MDARRSSIRPSSSNMTLESTDDDPSKADVTLLCWKIDLLKRLLIHERRLRLATADNDAASSQKLRELQEMLEQRNLLLEKAVREKVSIEERMSEIQEEAGIRNISVRSASVVNGGGAASPVKPKKEKKLKKSELESRCRMLEAELVQSQNRVTVLEGDVDSKAQMLHELRELNMNKVDMMQQRNESMEEQVRSKDQKIALLDSEVQSLRDAVDDLREVLKSKEAANTVARTSSSYSNGSSNVPPSPARSLPASSPARRPASVKQLHPPPAFGDHAGAVEGCADDDGSEEEAEMAPNSLVAEKDSGTSDMRIAELHRRLEEKDAIINSYSQKLLSYKQQIDTYRVQLRKFKLKKVKRVRHNVDAKIVVQKNPSNGIFMIDVITQKVHNIHDMRTVTGITPDPQGHSRRFQITYSDCEADTFECSDGEQRDEILAELKEFKSRCDQEL